MMSATAVPASLFVLLVATLSLSIMYGKQMSAEGRPHRRERGVNEYEDILAGNDFLSVFLESTLRRARTTRTKELVDFPQETTESYVRTSRESGSYFYEVPQSTDRQLNSFNSSDSSSSSGVIIGVHVSSSVGSQINKDNRKSESTSDVLDQNYLPSEEHPSIVAKSSKSELNVEEPQPITISNDNLDKSSTGENQGFQASVQNLPAAQHISFNPSSFIGNQNKENIPPFHHSFIYHDNPKEPGHARSVSYSTIIQAISPTDDNPSERHERKERNYETGTGYKNSYESPDEKSVGDKTNSKLETNTLEATSISSTTSRTSWAITDLQNSTINDETTKRSWEKPYSPVPLPQQLPKVYGKSEQNYEVDEAVSVVTNGRTHGVQEDPTKKSKSDQEKDQKHGYVVEGRNYRKYRVEERTPDGFIVGEYGVVSHDDGSLRGVRYTADGTINPRLIYDALMKFLAL